MEPANLVSLPIELIERIGSFLSASDLLSCSETCHYLRSALNSNAVWKRFLPEQDLSSLDESLKQQVLPQLDSLVPLCPNRLHFALKCHLLNNWRKGNFQKHKADAEFGKVGFRSIGGQMFYKGKYTFATFFNNYDNGKEIEVWDISGEPPVLYTCIDVSDRVHFDYCVLGSNFMIFECCKVDVYQITLPEKDFPLLYSFLVTNENPTIGQPIQHPAECNLQSHEWYHYVANQYLVSIKDSEGILCVWDIFSASKIGSFSLPKPGYTCSCISVLENHLFLSQYLTLNNVCFYFNLEERKFSDADFYYEKHNTEVLAYDSSVIIILEDVENECYDHGFDTVCKVYNFDTGKEVNKNLFFECVPYPIRSSTTIFNGTFILPCTNEFLIVDALSLEIVDKIPYVVKVDVIAHEFDVFGSLFVVTVGLKDELQLWDIQKRQYVGLLGDLTDEIEIFLNDTCSSLVYVHLNELCVLHFY